MLADSFVRALRWRKSDAPRPPIPATTDTGDPQAPNNPAVQAVWPSRAPWLYHLCFPSQNLLNGYERKQAGAGRLIMLNALTFDVQSMTPEPDRRIIARPMPTSAVDARQVIR